MKPALPLLLAAHLALAGCASAPTATPAAPVVTAWTAPVDPGAMEAAVVMDWWTRFNDPQLDALVARALVRNSDLRAATANLEAATALGREAAAALGPSGGVSSGLTRGRAAGLAQPPVGGPDRLPDQTLATLGANLGWEIDLFGRMRAAAAQAEAGRSEALWLRRQTEAAVAAAVVRAYLDAGYARQAADLSARRATALAARLSARERATLAGAVSRADVDADRQALSAAEAELAPLQGLAANAARRLATLTGDPPGSVAVTARPLASPDALPTGRPVDLLRRRPDVFVAEQRWAAAAAAARVAAAALYPQVSLGGQIGLAAAPGRLSEPGALTFGMGPSLTWSILDQPRLRARLAAADAGATAALAQWDGVVLAALEEADSAIETWVRASASASSAAAALAASERRFAAATARWNAGALSAADLEGARLEHLQSEIAATESALRAAQAWTAAQLALGAGWRDAVSGGRGDR